MWSTRLLWEFNEATRAEHTQAHGGSAVSVSSSGPGPSPTAATYWILRKCVCEEQPYMCFVYVLKGAIYRYSHSSICLDKNVGSDLYQYSAGVAEHTHVTLLGLPHPLLGRCPLSWNIKREKIIIKAEECNVMAWFDRASCFVSCQCWAWNRLICIPARRRWSQDRSN